MDELLTWSHDCRVKHGCELLDLEIAQVAKRSHAKGDYLGQCRWKEAEEEDPKEAQKSAIASNTKYIFKVDVLFATLLHPCLLSVSLVWVSDFQLLDTMILLW